MPAKAKVASKSKSKIDAKSKSKIEAKSEENDLMRGFREVVSIRSDDSDDTDPSNDEQEMDVIPPVIDDSPPVIDPSPPQYNFGESKFAYDNKMNNGASPSPPPQAEGGALIQYSDNKIENFLTASRPTVEVRMGELKTSRQQFLYYLNAEQQMLMAFPEISLHVGGEYGKGLREYGRKIRSDCATIQMVMDRLDAERLAYAEKLDRNTKLLPAIDNFLHIKNELLKLEKANTFLSQFKPNKRIRRGAVPEAMD